MRTRYTVIALILAQATSAQLLNGSFENDADEFDLSNWAWTCDQPQAVPAAPGEGMWACSKDFGNVKGCFPSYVYQVIPDVPVDMAFTLSGWARCEPGFVQSAVGIFFGHVGTGIYPTLDTGATTNATEWTYLSLTEVFQASPLDTAAVVLNAGTVAGPAFGLSDFDGITLEFAEGMADGDAQATPLVRVSPDARRIAVNALANERILICDALGRTLVQTTGSASGWRTLDVPDGTQWVLVSVDGNGKRRSQRLIVAQ